MTLILPFDPSGLDPRTASALDDIIAPIQTWTGKVDGVGRMIDVPYHASLFRSASVTATWTVESGDVRYFKYAIVGDLMYLRVNIVGSTTSAGMGNDLRILIPGNYQATDDAFLGLFQWNADTAAIDGVGRAFPTADGRSIRLLRDVLASSTAWPSGESHTFNVQMVLQFPVIAT